MKYKDVLTGEDIVKTDRLFAGATLNESSVGDDVVVVKPFELTNAKETVVQDLEVVEELDKVKKELNKVKLDRRELKKEVKALKEELKNVNSLIKNYKSLEALNDDVEEE